MVRIAPHPRYRVDGPRHHVDLPLAPWEGALGASVAVDTPGGEAKVKVPPGTSRGKRLRLRGRGIPNPRATRATCTPRSGSWCRRSSTDEERRLFEELGRCRLRSQAGAVTVPPSLAWPDRSGSTVDDFAGAAGLHPELVRRLVALGLLEAEPRRDRRAVVPPAQLAAAARLQRLRQGLGLNYAALGVVTELLDRITELEAALRDPPTRGRRHVDPSA